MKNLSYILLLAILLATIMVGNVEGQNSISGELPDVSESFIRTFNAGIDVTMSYDKDLNILDVHFRTFENGERVFYIANLSIQIRSGEKSYEANLDDRPKKIMMYPGGYSLWFVDDDSTQHIRVSEMYELKGVFF